MEISAGTEQILSGLCLHTLLTVFIKHYELLPNINIEESIINTKI